MRKLWITLLVVLFMLTADTVLFKPHAGAQERFLSSGAYEVFFGGAAGPGKTTCGIIEALRQIDHPQYRAGLFRRTYPLLSKPDGLIDKTKQFYPAVGGKYNESLHVWRFPSGAEILLAHMQREQDRFNYRGSRFHYVYFDELTEFTERQYLYLFSRVRTVKGEGLRCYVRSGSNPGNIGHLWVKNRFINTDIRNRVGYFARISNVDTRVDKLHPLALSRMFVPATFRDNPSLNADDYLRNLGQLDEVEYARLADGDWDAEDNTGRVYANWSSLNVATDAEYNPALPVIWGVDDGYAYGQGPGTASYHPRVILLCQITPTGGVNVFAEYVAAGELSEVSIASALKLPYAKPENAYVDSSAVELKARLWNADITTIGATHTVIEGIKNVRRLIANAQGVRLLKVHPRCQATIAEFGTYIYSEAQRAAGGDAQPVKMNDHCMDALRYACWHLRYGDA